MIRAIVLFGIALALLAGMVWWQWPSDEVFVSICDVGQGDGIVITHLFSQLVVDVGNPDGMMVSCLGSLLPFWDKSIEVVVITHADNDHLGGLPDLLKRYTVEQVITSAYALREVERVVAGRSRVLVSGAGDQWLFGNISGEVLWPPHSSPMESESRSNFDKNEMSLVWRMAYGKHSVWFAGDSGCESEMVLVNEQKIRPTEYLKVGHHGSKSSSCEPFLSILQPHQAFISVGIDNRYNHPEEAVISRLQSRDIKVTRTDETGTYTVKLSR